MWKRPYTVRRHGAQTLEGGYASAAVNGTLVMLDVQPLSPKELLALPEGDRATERVKAYGKAKISAADDDAQTPGDQLLCDGRWYECVSCARHANTMLGHYRSEWTLMPTQPSGTTTAGGQRL